MPGQVRPIAESTVEMLAAAYELDPAAVARDARVLGAWSVPLDEFVLLLRRYHKWDAGLATAYLGALRSAQQSNDVGCPWLANHE